LQQEEKILWEEKRENIWRCFTFSQISYWVKNGPLSLQKPSFFKHTSKITAERQDFHSGNDGPSDTFPTFPSSLWFCQLYFKIFVVIVFETRCHYVAQAGLELVILLPQPLVCWDDRCAPPHLVDFKLFFGGTGI
jgi:hypothetical protein